MAYFAKFTERGQRALQAAQQECDGRPYRVTYSLRPFESIIVKLPESEEK